MPVQHIAIDVYQISLRVGETLYPSLWTAAHFQGALRVANTVWQPADIVFDLRSYVPQEFALLNRNSNANLSPDDDKMYLLSTHSGRSGIGVCLVNTAVTTGGDLLGGYYERRFRSCFISFSHLMNQAGINLAHEFGHGLLGLGHPGGSGNLMQTHTPSQTNVGLTPDQIRVAQQNAVQLTS